MKISFLYIGMALLIACGIKQPEVAKNLTEDTKGSGDAKAIELAEKMMQAMGGSQTWNETRYLRFDFAVEADGKEVSRHSHLWDKFTGRYRVQGKTRDGKSYCIMFDDINKKSGKVFVDGKLLGSQEAEDKLQYGYNRFINDTYWLLMPWKLRDAGVTLRYDGVQKDTVSGKDYEVVHLAFDQVGLTPKDQYWAFIDPQTFLMVQWKFLLQDKEEGAYYWTNWKNYGRLKFADVKTDASGKRTIKTEKINLSDQMSDGVFTNYESILP